MMAVLARSTTGIRASARLARSRIEVSYAYGRILCSRLGKCRYRVARHGRHTFGFALRQLVLGDLGPQPIRGSPRHERGTITRAPGAQIQECGAHLAVVLHRLLDP